MRYVSEKINKLVEKIKTSQHDVTRTDCSVSYTASEIVDLPGVPPLSMQVKFIL
jgi:hypothetical protein